MGNIMSFCKLWPQREKPYRVGVYLGSFNPIHQGHLQLARQARDQFQLDSVEIVALKKPVHKASDFIADADRLTMNQLAVAAEDRLHASDADMVLAKPELKDLLAQFPNDPGRAKVKQVLQRTLGILESIKNKYAQKTGREIKVDYIVGADGLAGYPQAWPEEEFRQLIKSCRFLIAPRPNAPDIRKTIQAMRAANPDCKVRYRVLKVTPSALSSTEIRALMQKGKPVPPNLVPEAVRRYLSERTLLPAAQAHAG